MVEGVQSIPLPQAERGITTRFTSHPGIIKFLFDLLGDFLEETTPLGVLIISINTHTKKKISVRSPIEDSTSSFWISTTVVLYDFDNTWIFPLFMFVT